MPDHVVTFTDAEEVLIAEFLVMAAATAQSLPNVDPPTVENFIAAAIQVQMVSVVDWDAKRAAG